MILQNGATLAYLGDSIYELFIRNNLLAKGLNDVNQLHKEATKYTSGVAQAKIIKYYLANDILNEEELNYFKRGRNSKHSANRRSINVSDYALATGFEALIAYLYLDKQDNRLNELIELAIKVIEGGD